MGCSTSAQAHGRNTGFSRPLLLLAEMSNLQCPDMAKLVTGGWSSNTSCSPKAFALKLLPTCLPCCLPFYYLIKQLLISLHRRTEKKKRLSLTDTWEETWFGLPPGLFPNLHVFKRISFFHWENRSRGWDMAGRRCTANALNFVVWLQNVLC